MTTLGLVLAVVAVMGGLWKLLTRNRAARDAVLLRCLADDAAASILWMNPKAAPNQLVRQVVARLEAAPSTPTNNLTVLESAAAGALSRLGRSPASDRSSDGPTDPPGKARA